MLDEQEAAFLKEACKSQKYSQKKTQKMLNLEMNKNKLELQSRRPTLGNKFSEMTNKGNKWRYQVNMGAEQIDRCSL